MEPERGGHRREVEQHVQRHCGLRKPMNSKSFENILRTYYVPGSIPGVRETSVNKTGRVPALTELMAWEEGEQCTATTHGGGC